jgi:hypothetical protein
VPALWPSGTGRLADVSGVLEATGDAMNWYAVISLLFAVVFGLAFWGGIFLLVKWILLS